MISTIRLLTGMTRPDPLAGGTATGYVIKDAIDTDISRPGKHIA
jgi:hypothetical protein